MTPQIKDPQNLMDLYLQMMEVSEPPLLYHRWSFLSAVGAALGRRVWFPLGDSTVFPAQYIVLIGPPGARKSSALGVAKSLLEDSGYKYMAADRSSKEKFILDWEFGFDKINAGIEDQGGSGGRGGGDLGFGTHDLLSDRLDVPDSTAVKEAYVSASELQDFFGNGTNTFVPTLANLWDCPPKYQDRLKNSKSIYIPNPTLNLIGGATPSNFASLFNASIVGQGLLSRMILVYGAGQRMKLTIPPPISAEARLTFVKVLETLRTSLEGPVSHTPEAYKTLDSIYKGFTDLPDSRLAYYGSRRFTHLLKLCTIVAACELCLEIRKEHVVLANSILSYTENFMPKALGEFGKSKNSDVSQTVLEVIDAWEAKGGLDITELFKAVGQDVDSIHDLSSIIMKLKIIGKIQHVPLNGRHLILPLRRLSSKNHRHVDYDLLWEYKLGDQ